MVTLHKINFITNDYENTFVYDDGIDSINKDNISIFELPQSKKYLTIFVLIQEFNDLSYAQLVNCITSIKVQSYINIQTVIINMDKNKHSQKTIKKIADDTCSKCISLSSDNVAAVFDTALWHCDSEYVAFINYSDVIPRIKDIEFVVNSLFEKKYDFLTLMVKYFDSNENDFDISSMATSVLKSTMNFHYSAYFKTKILKSYKFVELLSVPFDEAMVSVFEKNSQKGNHIISRTQMNLLQKIEIDN